MVLDKLKSWFSPSLHFANWDRDVLVTDDEASGDGASSVHLTLYTATNLYHIKACQAPGKSYLGCIAATRKPRAGENWTRGNDLPDGPFSKETWDKIIAAIVGYELVKIHREQEERNPELLGVGG